MDRKIWFSPLAFATLHKEPKPNHQREGELLGIRNRTVHSHHTQTATTNQSISHRWSPTDQYLLSIMVCMVAFQGLLNPLFLAVSLTCPGVPCQVHKHRFLCLASSRGKDVSALPYFASLHSYSNFTPLFARQGEVCNEEIRGLPDQDYAKKLMAV